MKIKEEHKKELFKMMDEALSLPGTRDAIASHKLLGLGDKRFRWDVFHAAKARDRHIGEFVTEFLYAYMNDKHIDSVLKRYVAERGY